jgi:alkylhydroperoxidase/carboxymuconolactone decarboxylase family protein YurZ
MTLKLTKDRDAIFSTCSESTLPGKTTHLINLAAHLGRGSDLGACNCIDLAMEHGATFEEVNAVACSVACACGPTAQDTYIKAWRASEESNRAFARLPSSALGFAADRHTHSLDESIFQSHNLCTLESLDRKTALLVDLAACLVAGCDCASGLIVQAQTEGATPEEIARVGCLVACACGMDKKYTFLTALQNTDNWKPIVKDLGRAMHAP